MADYVRTYRFGMTPREAYGEAAGDSIAAMLDRAEADRRRPPAPDPEGPEGPAGDGTGRRTLGRALDLGCGRGEFTPLLAARGWQAVGIDGVPASVEAARRRGNAGVSYVAGDVTDLASARLGTFDLFFDVGCFHGLDARRRHAVGQGVTTLARPGAVLLMLAYGPSQFRTMVGGASREEVEEAFPRWELRAIDPADTTGLGWPMNRTKPRWYRLRLKP
ncbi:class I SAM-dependent methyltransferase [Yinghuangia soli]|uniref:Class I SAM-dependent methyltransferase n=1 Tax=Yinghuangia soli TaxID=2908204 RepID=A0AA41TZ16_9ACTN|nr:class I SAM-dependent methyltransferase [Yinghuangia soli]MCF2527026.1 class I SAM-dependent methyltransferase [Yinghuangia soli]